MGNVMKNYNNCYIKLQKQFKSAHNLVLETMSEKYSNKDYFNKFNYMFPCEISKLKIEKNY